MDRVNWKQENIKRLQKEREAAALKAANKLQIFRDQMRRKKESREEEIDVVAKQFETELKALQKIANAKQREQTKMENKITMNDLQNQNRNNFSRRREVVAKDDMSPTELGKVFFESGMFKDIKSASQAVVKIIAGREMGLTPIQAMNNLFVLEGKVGFETKVFLSKVKKSGKYDYTVKFIYDDNKKLESCDVTFSTLKKDDWVEIGTANFSVYDAARLGLINKFNYKNYLDLMLFYRAATKGIKMFCPDVLDGAVFKEEYQEIISADEKPAAEEVSLELPLGE
jgi:hypothetical protein